MQPCALQATAADMCRKAHSHGTANQHSSLFALLGAIHPSPNGTPVLGFKPIGWGPDLAPSPGSGPATALTTLQSTAHTLYKRRRHVAVVPQPDNNEIKYLPRHNWMTSINIQL
jgi:hypothetical protein